MEDTGLRPPENRGSGTGGTRGKGGKCKFSKATNFAIEKGLKGGRIPLNLVPWAFSLRKWERQCLSNMVYGHPSILSIPIPKTRVIRASPSHITLAIWVRVRVGVTGDAHTSLPVGFGNGDAQSISL